LRTAASPWRKPARSASVASRRWTRKAPSVAIAHGAVVFLARDRLGAHQVRVAIHVSDGEIEVRLDLDDICLCQCQLGLGLFEFRDRLLMFRLTLL
jgi:hypothetical protein